MMECQKRRGVFCPPINVAATLDVFFARGHKWCGEIYSRGFCSVETFGVSFRENRTIESAVLTVFFCQGGEGTAGVFLIYIPGGGSNYWFWIFLGGRVGIFGILRCEKWRRGKFNGQGRRDCKFHDDESGWFGWMGGNDYGYI